MRVTGESYNMLTLDVNLSDARLRETLDAVEAKLSPESCAKVAAEAGADVVRENFITLSRSRHRQGQRLNFYQQAADSVIREVSGGDALIRIPHTGVAQRYYGGVIKPSGRPSAVTGRPVERLAIGLTGSPGEGHVPADFPALFLVTKRGVKRGDKSENAFLARKTGGGVQRLFVLVGEVRQDEDKSVLPKDDKILEAAAECILDLYDAATEKNT